MIRDNRTVILSSEATKDPIATFLVGSFGPLALRMTVSDLAAVARVDHVHGRVRRVP
jgi:hypothetical protein